MYYLTEQCVSTLLALLFSSLGSWAAQLWKKLCGASEILGLIPRKWNLMYSWPWIGAVRQIIGYCSIITDCGVNGERQHSNFTDAACLSTNMILHWRIPWKHGKLSIRKLVFPLPGSWGQSSHGEGVQSGICVPCCFICTSRTLKEATGSDFLWCPVGYTVVWRLAL